MPGLVPGIYAFVAPGICRERVDGRVKPGPDDHMLISPEASA
jgi:hypothetical protein